MISFSHIGNVVSSELSTYHSGDFLMMLIFVWFAYLITGSIKKSGYKIFWAVYALIHLYEILISDMILRDPFLYFSITVFLLQLNFQKLVKNILKALRERAQRKVQQCVDRNMYYDSVEAKVAREEAIAREQDIKNRQEKEFLAELNKKLDAKIDAKIDAF